MHADIEILPRPNRPVGRPKIAPVAVATDRPSWSRQPGETLAAFEAFATYRDAGPERTLAKVAVIVGRHPNLVQNWSAKNGWPARVADWNRSVEPEHRAQMIERQRQLLDEHFAGWRDIGRAAREQVAKNLPGMSDQHLVALALGGAKHELMVVGISEKSTSAGPVVQVNVGQAVPAFDTRLSALATAVATWGSQANLSADQLAGLSAAILAVQQDVAAR